MVAVCSCALFDATHTDHTEESRGCHLHHRVPDIRAVHWVACAEGRFKSWILPCNTLRGKAKVRVSGTDRETDRQTDEGCLDMDMYCNMCASISDNTVYSHSEMHAKTGIFNIYLATDGAEVVEEIWSLLQMQNETDFRLFYLPDEVVGEYGRMDGCVCVSE